MRLFCATIAAALIGMSAACSATGAKCVVGASVSCACVDGLQGAQVCQADGTLGACSCEAGSSTTGVSSSSGSSTSSVSSSGEIGISANGSSTGRSTVTSSGTTIGFGDSAGSGGTGTSDTSTGGSTLSGAGSGGQSATGSPSSTTTGGRGGSGIGSDAGVCEAPQADTGACNYVLAATPVLVGAPMGAFNEASIAIADFNRDGRLDLAVTDTGFGAVDIVFNAGDGGFLAPQDVLVGSDGYNVAVGDFNGDGWPDFAASSSSEGVTLFLNHGDAGFVSGTAFPGTTLGVATADLNRDGFDDLAFIDDYSSVVIALSDGGGGYATSSLSGSSSYSATMLALSDLNRDGWLDLVVPYFSLPGNFNALSVFLNFGQGVFDAGSGYPVYVDALPSVVDLNQDCFPDLAFPNAVLLNEGNGTFGAPTPLPVQGTLVASADVNRDGWPDLLVAGGSVSGVELLLNAADEGWSSVSTLAGLPTPQWLGVADINGDGVPDLIVLVPAGAEVFFGSCQ